MVSTGVAPVAPAAATDFGWRPLPIAGAAYSRWKVAGGSDEERVVAALYNAGVRAVTTAGRYQSHDLEVTLGIKGVEPGFYEVKRLSLRPGGRSVDPRFKAGRRGEKIYGRRDSDIKCFARNLEDYLDKCLWGVDAVTSTHDFVDQALTRRHGKKFHERLLRLANAGKTIPQLMPSAQMVLNGGVRAYDIEAGFGDLSGIFIIADHIYTLVKPNEIASFIGFDSASAEGPKLKFLGVVPLQTTTRKKKGS